MQSQFHMSQQSRTCLSTEIHGTLVTLGTHLQHCPHSSSCSDDYSWVLVNRGLKVVECWGGRGQHRWLLWTESSATSLWRSWQSRASKCTLWSVWTEIWKCIDGRAYCSYTASLYSPLQLALSMFFILSSKIFFRWMKCSWGAAEGVIIDPMNLCGASIWSLSGF